MIALQTSLAKESSECNSIVHGTNLLAAHTTSRKDTDLYVQCFLLNKSSRFPVRTSANTKGKRLDCEVPNSNVLFYFVHRAY